MQYYSLNEIARSCKAAIAILTLAILIALPVHALDAPMKIRILTFPENSFWTPVETIVEVNSETRRQRTVKLEAYISSGSCGDQLFQFQDRALDVMVKDGYITDDLRQSIIHDFDRLFKPQQLVLVQLFSEVTSSDYFKEVDTAVISEQDAQARILGVFKNRHSILPDEKITVSRGTMYAVRSFTIEPNGPGKKLMPRDLPWSIGDLPPNLTQSLDPGKVPHAVELGRMHVESKILPGDLHTLLRTTLYVLKGQADVFGIDPHQVVVTGHFKGASRLRYMTGKFPLRILDDSSRKKLEEDLTGTLRDYLELPLPSTSEEWRKYEDSIVFGNLGTLALAPNEVSEFAHRVSSHLGWNIPADKALGVFIDFSTAIREDLDFQNPITGFANTNPIVIQDYGTPFLVARFQKIVSEFGFDFGSPAGQSFQQLLEQLDFFKAFPDTAMAHWTERRLIIPLKNTDDLNKVLGGMDMKFEFQNQPPPKNDKDKASFSDLMKMTTPMLLVTNIDQRGAHSTEEGDGLEQYLAAMILGLADTYDHRMREMFEKGEQHHFMQAIVEHPIEALRPQFKFERLGFRDLAYLYPLAMASSDPEVQQALQNIGGQKKLGVSFRLDLVSTIEETLKEQMASFKLRNETIDERIELRLAFLKHHGLPITPEVRAIVFQQIFQEEAKLQMAQFLKTIPQPMALLETQQTPIYHFTGKEIDELKKRYPQFAENARARMWPAHYRERLRSHLTTFF